MTSAASLRGLQRRLARALVYASLSAFALTTSFSSDAQTVPAYTFVDLGTLRGNGTLVTGINNAGQISGYGYFEPANSRAFRITPIDTNNDTIPDTWAVTDVSGNNSRMEVLPLSTTYHYSEGHGINASGAVGGQALGDAYTLPQDAAYWSPTNATQTINGSVWAWDINDTGSMVGERDGNKNAGPTLWRLVNGSFVATFLGIPGGQARGVNNQDQVVGTDGNVGVAYLWLPSSAYGLPSGKTSLGTFGGTYSYAHRINTAGQVVGNAYLTGNLGWHPYLWTPPDDTSGFGVPGAKISLLTGDWISGDALALNNPATGQPLLITGSSNNPAGQNRAFVWDSNLREMRDLNVLTVNPPQEGMNDGRSVNVSGMIVGNYNVTLADGKVYQRPFLLLPNATLPDVAAVPAAATGVNVTTLASNQVSLSWTNDPGDDNGVKMDRSTNGGNYGVQKASLPTEAASYTDGSVVQGMQYTYRVTPFNVKGYAATTEITVTTPGTPLAPTNCRTAVLSSTSIRLRWNNNSNTQTAVYVERSTNAAFTSPTVLTVAGNATVVDTTGLSNNTTYYFRVRSQNAEGFSPYSNTATGITPRR